MVTVQRKNWLPLVFGPEQQDEAKKWLQNHIKHHKTQYWTPRLHSSVFCAYRKPSCTSKISRTTSSTSSLFSACISHGQNPWPCVLEVKVLILELFSINGFAPSTIALGFWMQTYGLEFAGLLQLRHLSWSHHPAAVSCWAYGPMACPNFCYAIDQIVCFSEPPQKKRLLKNSFRYDDNCKWKCTQSITV